VSILQTISEFLGRPYSKASRDFVSIDTEEIKRKNSNATKILQLLAYFDRKVVWPELLSNGKDGYEVPK
jgi:hypothetical protein